MVRRHVISSVFTAILWYRRPAPMTLKWKSKRPRAGAWGVKTQATAHSGSVWHLSGALWLEKCWKGGGSTSPGTSDVPNAVLSPFPFSLPSTLDSVQMTKRRLREIPSPSRGHRAQRNGRVLTGPWISLKTLSVPLLSTASQIQPMREIKLTVTHSPIPCSSFVQRHELPRSWFRDTHKGMEGASEHGSEGLAAGRGGNVAQSRWARKSVRSVWPRDTMHLQLEALGRISHLVRWLTKETKNPGKQPYTETQGRTVNPDILLWIRILWRTGIRKG